MADFEKISIQSEIQTFKEHLDVEGNDRVFFSGKFGSGKTYFLKEFFNESQFKGEYNVIHLYPVNYSVATNEDIFELIKADLIVRVLDDFSENLEFEKFELTTDWALFLSLSEHPEYLIPFISAIPKVGSSIKSVLDVIKNVRKGMQDKKNELKLDRYQELLGHVKWLNDKVGTVYEENAITKVLQNCVAQLSSEISNKQSILILDDLDRIDPGHIFRILNVFAAHFDSPFEEGSKNKFGFDKIILVGDAENVRSIFHHRYGVNTDFQGYLDKFRSSTVYNYSLLKTYRGILDKYASRIRIVINGDEVVVRKITRNYLVDLMSILALNNEFNLRSLIKVGSSKIILSHLQYGHISLFEYPIFIAFEILVQLLGSINDVIAHFQRCNKIQLSEKMKFHFLPNLLLVSKLDTINLNEDRKEQPIHGYEGVSVLLKYEWTQRDRFYHATFSESSSTLVDVKKEIMQALNNVRQLLN